MQKKLTITLDEQVYEGLQSIVGQENISRFIEDLVRPHLIAADVSESGPHSRTQADIDAMREDWGKWYAANQDKVLSPAEIEAGYRAQAEEEARLGDALYENEDWEEWDVTKRDLSEAELEAGYRAMAADEEQETEALEWIEGTLLDVNNESR